MTPKQAGQRLNRSIGDFSVSTDAFTNLNALSNEQLKHYSATFATALREHFGTGPYKSALQELLYENMKVYIKGLRL